MSVEFPKPRDPLLSWRHFYQEYLLGRVTFRIFFAAEVSATSMWRRFISPDVFIF